MVVGSTGKFGDSTMDGGAHFWVFGSISVSLTLRTDATLYLDLRFEIYKQSKSESSVSPVGYRGEILERGHPPGGLKLVRVIEE